MANFHNSPVANFQIHPEVQKTYREKDLNCLQFTMEKFGQQTPVKVIKREGQLYIIDGVSRFKVAEQLHIPSLIYTLVEVEDKKVMEYRMLSNVTTKRTMTELCLEAHYVLDILGTSQGKKRDLLGFDDFENNENYGKVGKKRFDLACAYMGIPMKGSTLRKVVKVFDVDFNPEGNSKTGTLELLDAGKISIDKAHQLICDFERKKEDNESSKSHGLYIRHSNVNNENKPYKLYCKSSIKMDEVEDGSIDMMIDSHPYFQQRDYRNQDELLHGQEGSIDDYLKNFKSFNLEKYKKLKPGGVLCSVIGESYKGGYQSVCARAEMVLREIGFTLLDVLVWVKTNQKYTPHPLRFQNSYERVIVAYKPGATPYFKEVKRKGAVALYAAKKTSSGGYYMASPETCITNVIVTPVFNPSVLRKIDPNFKHDAPCPEELYELIEAYSKPGDTILDSFVGSGTVGVGLKMGRNVIGYDVDHESIEFSQKRFDHFLKQNEHQTESPLALCA